MPLTTPEANLGWYLFIPVHLRHFGRSQHVAGFVISTAYLASTSNPCPHDKECFLAQASLNKHQTSTNPLDSRIASKEKSSNIQGFEFWEHFSSSL
jgi:hypothetical protein